jgi:pimeloyl-ACP methyl ester carboxylesterase
MRRVFLAILAAAAIAIAIAYAIPVRTPPIVDPDGVLYPDGVATLEKVTLGGIDQWILVRGSSRSNPVLLFLHGGPGMPAMYLEHAFGRDLERHFLVVHWDQRGAGKSYSDKVPPESMNVQQILSDARELIGLLRERYGPNKIYLVGHSWGSYLGVILAKENPELFQAYVGIGQVTDSERQGSLSDMFIVRRARESENRRAVSELGKKGELAREKWLFKFGGELHGKTSYSPLLWAGLTAPEYSLWDALNVARGSRFSSDHMRYNVILGPLMDEITSLSVPVYFFQGRYDFVTPSELVEEYMDELRAPSKTLVWFENSAHYPFFEEPDHFTEEMLRVMRETRGGR